MQYGLNIRPKSEAEGELDLLAMGGLVNRLDPGIIPFRKATECHIHVSGGEFNVAANLADCFRLKTGVATAMVDYPIGDLIAAQGRATAQTLAKNGCPVRTMHIDTLDEAALGELLMHFMLETIIAAHLLGVDPFDQPAVEEGKVLAKKYLAGA